MVRQTLHRRIRWKRVLLIAILIAAAVVGVLFASTLRKYTGYESVRVTKQQSAGSFSYTVFQGNLVRYGKDGAIYTNARGENLWNKTYEMQSPHIDKCRNYLIIYDRDGSEIDLMEESGEVSKMTTSYPISKAAVSGDGTVAALMQDGTTAHIEVFSSDGSKAASGEIHMSKGGYPLGIALSDDGSKMMLSLISIKDGKLGTTINFYNFGSGGKDKIDNIVSSFTYPGVIMPEIGFSNRGKAVAIGTGKIVLYTSSGTPREQKTITPEGKMKSVFSNSHCFGYITGEKQKNGEVKDTVEMYGFSGFHKFSKPISEEYSTAELMDDNELLLRTNSRVLILSSFGNIRFNRDMKQEFTDFLQYSSGKHYYMIHTDDIEEIRLR